MSGRNSHFEFEGDAGGPSPDFTGAANIQLHTVAPALGVVIPRQGPEPEYLDFDPKGRGVVQNMFNNTGISYLMGTTAGCIYGAAHGYRRAPAHVGTRVKWNGMLHAGGRLAAKTGNALGAAAVLYSLFEGLFDHKDIDNYIPDMAPQVPYAPIFAAGLTGLCVAPKKSLLSVIGMGGMGPVAVAVTYAAYNILGWPHGRFGYLFF